MKKQYKALMLDLDGTTIPNKIDGMPSPRVKEAIAKASKLVHVGIATARPPFLLNNILNDLVLSGPSIITGGSQVIDCPSRKVVWEKPIMPEDVQVLNALCKELNITYSSDKNHEIIDLSQSNSGKFFQLYFGALNEASVNRISKTFQSVPSIALHKIPSWKKGTLDLVVTHAEATKQHGIMEVAKILGIETHEIIAVGDGYIDFPLLMACGLKVAMGNAVPELKEIADYVAPTVEDDGLADVIEKFIL